MKPDYSNLRPTQWAVVQYGLFGDCAVLGHDVEGKPRLWKGQAAEATQLQRQCNSLLLMALAIKADEISSYWLMARKTEHIQAYNALGSLRTMLSWQPADVATNPFAFAYDLHHYWQYLRPANHWAEDKAAWTIIWADLDKAMDLYPDTYIPQDQAWQNHLAR